MLAAPLFQPTRPPKGDTLEPFPVTATAAELLEIRPEFSAAKPPAYPTPVAVTPPETETASMLPSFPPTRPPTRSEPVKLPDATTLEIVPLLNPASAPT